MSNEYKSYDRSVNSRVGTWELVLSTQSYIWILIYCNAHGIRGARLVKTDVLDGNERISWLMPILQVTYILSFFSCENASNNYKLSSYLICFAIKLCWLSSLLCFEFLTCPLRSPLPPSHFNMFPCHKFVSSHWSNLEDIVTCHTVVI